MSARSSSGYSPSVLRQFVALVQQLTERRAAARLCSAWRRKSPPLLRESSCCPGRWVTPIYIRLAIIRRATVDDARQRIRSAMPRPQIPQFCTRNPCVLPQRSLTKLTTYFEWTALGPKNAPSCSDQVWSSRRSADSCRTKSTAVHYKRRKFFHKSLYEPKIARLSTATLLLRYAGSR